VNEVRIIKKKDGDAEFSADTSFNFDTGSGEFSSGLWYRVEVEWLPEVGADASDEIQVTVADTSDGTSKTISASESEYDTGGIVMMSNLRTSGEVFNDVHFDEWAVMGE